MRPAAVARAVALVKALGYPARVQLLEAAIAAQDRVSPSDLAALTDLDDLSSLSYHVRQLAAAGLLDAAGTEPRRNVTVHYYRPSAKAAPALEAVRALAEL